jgi:stage V sporulation protein R
LWEWTPQDLASGGLPHVKLVDDDHEGKGELLLVHRHDGRDLQVASTGETLKGIAELWGKPAHLSTLEDGQPRLLSSDGKQVKSGEGSVEGSERKGTG